MAEQLANLSKSADKIQVFSFPVTNFSITSAWGSIYDDFFTCDTGINLQNKKIFISYIPSDQQNAWVGTQGVIDNTKVRIALCRGNTTTNMNGTIYIMVIG